jgi:hypothetical protein
MNLIVKLVPAVGLIGAGFGMTVYEWARIKAGRPILRGRPSVQLYWMIYLSLFVLGITAFLAAILR